MFPRELSEEEKAEAEAAKNTKGKAAPPKGKGAPKEEEPTPEELAKQEAEKAAKEEAQRLWQEEWDALDEEEKFHRTNEDIQKQPCIHLQN